MVLGDYQRPRYGIYAVRVTLEDGSEHPGVASLGVRPTFESGRGVLIETYLIDRNEDLYGKVLRVAFVERLRGERAYHEVDELIEQMKRDVEDARRVCAGFTRL